MNKKEKFLYFILVLGILVSLFLVYEHFSSAASEFCSFGGDFDCGVVNKSPYANLDGISYLLTVDFGLRLPIVDIKSIHWILDLFTSNAFLAFLVLVLLFTMLYSYKKHRDFLFIKYNKILSWVKGILIFSIVYGLYLFYIQHFILRTYCIFCLALDLVFILSLILVWRER